MAWSAEECALVVGDYFAMLEQELRGERYNKAEHNRNLQRLLHNRSQASIEFKHRNISAVLIHLGYMCIRGYKPAWNYQALLHKTVAAHLNRQQDQIVKLEGQLIHALPDTRADADWGRQEVKAPIIDRDSSAPYQAVTDFRPQRVDFATRDARNRELGAHGEQYVLELEQMRLTSLGREDLAQEIEWTSQKYGDGAGYDIRSFDERGEQERFIEVKTTNAGKYQPFHITRNEVAFSAQNAPNYQLFRVFQFAESPRFYRLQGDVKDKLVLESMVYRAGFGQTQ